MQTLTIVQQQQKLATTLKQKVCAMLEITEEEYCLLQYKRGLKFLYKYCEGDTTLINQFETNKLFWNWFKNGWSLRDHEFVKSMESIQTTMGEQPLSKVARKLYKETNNHMCLIEDGYVPDKIVLQDVLTIYNKKASLC